MSQPQEQPIYTDTAPPRASSGASPPMARPSADGAAITQEEQEQRFSSASPPHHIQRQQQEQQQEVQQVQQQNYQQQQQDASSRGNTAPSQSGQNGPQHPPVMSANGLKKVYTIRSAVFEVDPQYDLIKAIGIGAYGLVCSARDTVQNRFVAIKKLPKLFEDLVDGRRVLREIRILRWLGRHPNILELVGVARPRDTSDSERNSFREVYFITELLDADLSQLLRSRQRLSIDHHAYISFQLLAAMAFIHNAGIIHRDLKPSNLLVNANCEIRVCDFGLSRANVPLQNFNNNNNNNNVAALMDWLPEQAEQAVINRNSYVRRYTPFQNQQDQREQTQNQNSGGGGGDFLQMNGNNNNNNTYAAGSGAFANGDQNNINNNHHHLAEAAFAQQQALGGIINPAAQQVQHGIIAGGGGGGVGNNNNNNNNNQNNFQQQENNNFQNQNQNNNQQQQQQQPMQFDLTEYVITRWFRPPELLLGVGYNHSVDLWSVGCILMEVITRRPLFDGKNYMEQLEKIAELVPMPDPSQVTTMLQRTRNQEPAKCIENLRRIHARSQYAGFSHQHQQDQNQNLSSSSATSTTTPELEHAMEAAGYDDSVRRIMRYLKLPPEHAQPTTQMAKAVDLISKLLNFHLALRPTAEQALQHPFLARHTSGPENAAALQQRTTFTKEQAERCLRMYRSAPGATGVGALEAFCDVSFGECCPFNMWAFDNEARISERSLRAEFWVDMCLRE